LPVPELAPARLELAVARIMLAQHVSLCDEDLDRFREVLDSRHGVLSSD
jgi:hypothetical protein